MKDAFNNFLGKEVVAVYNENRQTLTSIGKLISVDQHFLVLEKELNHKHILISLNSIIKVKEREVGR